MICQRYLCTWQREMKISLFLIDSRLRSFNNTISPLGDTTFGGINPSVSVHAPILFVRVFEKNIVSVIVLTIPNGEYDMAQFFLLNVANGRF